MYYHYVFVFVLMGKNQLFCCSHQMYRLLTPVLLIILRTSVMSRCQARVHALLRMHIPNGIYIHCSTHRLSLDISDTCVTCQIISLLLQMFIHIFH